MEALTLLRGNDFIRREIAQRLTKLISMRDADKRIDCVHNMLPEYKVEFSGGFPISNVRYLSTWSTKKKGKRRIYSDMSIDNADYALFLSYLSKRDVIRLTRGLPARTIESIHLDFDNRWVLSIRKPASTCKKLREFFNDLVMYEIKSNKANHPPRGRSTGYTEISEYDPIWKFGPNISRIFDQNLATEEILCTIRKLVKH